LRIAGSYWDRIIDLLTYCGHAQEGSQDGADVENREGVQKEPQESGSAQSGEEGGSVGVLDGIERFLEAPFESEGPDGCEAVEGAAQVTKHPTPHSKENKGKQRHMSTPLIP